MSGFLKQPLLHFLLLGAALFWFYEQVAGVNADERVIVVDDQRLATWLQYRSRAFDPATINERIAAMTPEELDFAVTELVREEALYREALSMQMDENDNVIRRRLLQKMDFITTGFANDAVEISDDDIAGYYAANRERYRIEPWATFTHVYFSAERHGPDEAQQLAVAKRDELNNNRATFDQSLLHGERFPYFTNYVERTPEFVAGHFGPEMAAEVFALEASDQLWYGPLASPYGYHVVMVTRTVPAVIPELEDIRAQVTDDLRREKVQEQQVAAVDDIVASYQVRRELSVDAARD